VRKSNNIVPTGGVAMKFGNFNFLQTSGPLQASNGTALHLRSHKSSYRRPDVSCSQVEHVVRGKEKINITDLNVFWFIQHFIGLRLVLQALYYSAELQLSKNMCQNICFCLSRFTTLPMVPNC